MSTPSGKHEAIVRIIVCHFPSAQAIYQLGVYETPEGWDDVELDFGILLPPSFEVRDGMGDVEACQRELSTALGQPVDLVNCGAVPPVIQRDIVENGTLLFCGEPQAVAEFERKARAGQ